LGKKGVHKDQEMEKSSLSGYYTFTVKGFDETKLRYIGTSCHCYDDLMKEFQIALREGEVLHYDKDADMRISLAMLLINKEVISIPWDLM
jgi:hypothetical protein